MPRETGWVKETEFNCTATFKQEIYPAEGETLYDCLVYARRVYHEDKYLILISGKSCIVSKEVKVGKK